MEKIIKKLENIPDQRQEWKVKHKLSDIVAIVLFATISNADAWEEIEAFAIANREFLMKYLVLENGIPSHDTIQRVMSTIDPSVLQNFQREWNETLNNAEGEKIKKILNIDGKTMRGSKNKNQRALHVVTAYCKEDGICFGQKAVNEKENEIIAIPDLLDEISVRGCVVTIDAMGTQAEIAEKIIKKKADYVLAVKGNQPNLHNDIKDYFNDSELKAAVKSGKGYKRTTEKARGQIEIREYFQTDEVSWIHNKTKWKNLNSIGIVEKTVLIGDVVKKETRYFISSLPVDIDLFSSSVRGHWAIESMHWHLDVTFKEDSNKTLDKTAALNMNIIRKISLSVLKILDLGKRKSLKLKRYMISVNSTNLLEKILLL
jgi:predicted transposase YbfD/YdcC